MGGDDGLFPSLLRYDSLARSAVVIGNELYGIAVCRNDVMSRVIMHHETRDNSHSFAVVAVRSNCFDSKVDFRLYNHVFRFRFVVAGINL